MSTSDTKEVERIEAIIKPVLEKMTFHILKERPSNIVSLINNLTLASSNAGVPSETRKLYY